MCVLFLLVEPTYWIWRGLKLRTSLLGSVEVFPGGWEWGWVAMAGLIGNQAISVQSLEFNLDWAWQNLNPAFFFGGYHAELMNKYWLNGKSLALHGS